MRLKSKPVRAAFAAACLLPASLAQTSSPKLFRRASAQAVRESYPQDEAHRNYVERYNTRVVASPPPGLFAAGR